LPAQAGKSAIEMFQAAADGEIAALWIVCTNPAQSLPDQATVRRALERCEFVIVQEAFGTTATAAHADLLLPATTWGEKDGTVTNSDRHISRVRPAVAAPGQARHDWQIAVDIARRIEACMREAGSPARRADGSTLFPYDSPESVWNEHRESTRGRDLDITGLSYAMLDTQGPQPWPLRAGDTAGTVRLYADGRFPTTDGRARFAAVQPRALAEKRDAHYPFSLNTGRLRDQWHGLSRTGTLGRLYGQAPEPTVDLHPSDLTRLKLKAGDLVQLTSRRGSLVLPVSPSTTVAPTQAFVAMHWGDEVLGGRHRGGVNALTVSARCPQSRQPELKHAALKLRPAALPWQLMARAWLPADVALQRRAELLAACSALDYAACMLFGREAAPADAPGPSRDAAAVGVWLRAAAPVAPDAAWLQDIETLLGLGGTDVLRYADPQRGQRRCVRLQAQADGSARVRAFVLAGDIQAAGWVGHLLMDELPAQAYGRALLAGSARPPADMASRGAQVCNCFDVRQPEIDTTLAQCTGTPEERLRQLQTRLKCGTQCGSCLPALRQQVLRTPAPLTPTLTVETP
jgi:assimilatory nitrate reductase catalytic subunit